MGKGKKGNGEKDCGEKGNGEHERRQLEMSFFSVVVTTTCTTVTMGPMQTKSVTVRGVFSPPTVSPSPPALSLLLTNVVAHLMQSSDGGVTFTEIQQQPMSLVSTNNYTYTFSGADATKTYKGMATGTWAVTGSIADTGAANC